MSAERRPVIVLRWALLLAACLPALAAFGALAPDPQPAANRVLVASVVALLAPLFWPGLAAAPLRTLARTLGWSVAAVLLACGLMAVLALLTPGRAAWAPVLAVGAMLLPIVLLTHALAAGLQAWWLRAQAWNDAAVPGTRWAAGLVAALALALAGAAPLWLGPAAELLNAGQAGTTDAVIAASPLNHLSMASGLDLLRTEWLYRNANLAALPVNDTVTARVAAFYATACTLFALALLALQRRPAATPPKP